MSQQQVQAFLQAVLTECPTHYGYALGADKTFKRTSVHTKQELISVAPQLIAWGNQHNRNVYFAPAGFELPKDINPYLGRHNQYVSKIKCLWLDVDLAESKDRLKGFQSADEIYTAFTGEIKKHAIPAPTYVVMSGRGVHFYWLLDAEYLPHQWYPVQMQMARAFMNLGYIIDVGVSMRMAGIMRIPCSYNTKVNQFGYFREYNPSIVHKLSDVSKQLETLSPVSQAMPWSGLSMINRPSFIPIEDFSLAEWGMQDPKQPRWEVIIQSCGYLQWYVEHQSTACNDDWLPAMSIARQCENGIELVHTLSQGHPSYNYEEVEKRISSLYNSFSCKMIHASTSYGAKCEKCKHWSKDGYFKPTSLDRRIVTVDITDPEQQATVLVETVVNKQVDYDTSETAMDTELGTPLVNSNVVSMTVADIAKFIPENYQIAPASDNMPTGAVIYAPPNKAEEVISDIIAYVVGTVDINGLKEYVIRAHIPREPAKDIRVAGSLFSKPTDLVGFLNDRGVIPNLEGRRKDLFVSYLRHSAMLNQTNYDSTFTRSQFGWAENRSTFVLGGWAISGIQPQEARATQLSGECVEYLNALTPPTTATVKKWTDACKMYEHKGMELAQFVICASLGTPLLGLMPATYGTLINLFSTGSGIGKTYLGLTALSIWGRPQNDDKHRGLSGIRTDTIKSAYKRLATMQHLPIYTDETTTQSAKDAYDFVYQLTQGREMARLNRSGTHTVMSTGSWQTIAFSSSNISVLDKINSVLGANHEAIHNRVIELDMTKLRSMRDVYNQDGTRKYSDTDIDKNFAVMFSENYGIVGQDFIRRIVSKRDALIKLWYDVDAHLQKIFNFTQPERFWRAVMVSSIMALRLGKMFGYFNYNEQAVIDTMVSALRGSRSELKESKFDLLKAVTDFLMFHQANGVVQERDQDFARCTGTANQPSFWRHDEAESTVYIYHTVLKDWLQKTYNLTTSEVERALQDHDVDKARVYLLKNVQLAVNKTQTRCCVFPDIVMQGN